METNTGILWDVIWYIALDYMCIYNMLPLIVCIACTTDGRQGENIEVGGEGSDGGGSWDPVTVAQTLTNVSIIYSARNGSEQPLWPGMAHSSQHR